ncbi:MAG: hypothetical protein JW849_08865 [Phycisphaerae bacterium]|nr:hypothetical protein [Phycisphaerae bacterium]
MLDQLLLREQFKTLQETQREALGQYESAARDADPAARADLDQLCREKRRHLELTERLLEIVEE